MEVDSLNCLSSSEPLVEIQVIDDTRQPMNEVLTDFITDFAGRLDDRSKYNTSLEYASLTEPSAALSCLMRNRPCLLPVAVWHLSLLLKRRIHFKSIID